MSKALLAMLIKDVMCEEESILTLATVSATDIDYGNTPNPDLLIGRGFKSLVLYTGTEVRPIEF